MQIFVSIASYQDPLLKNTIEDCFSKAANKDSLVFGICDQSDEPLDLSNLCFQNQIRYEHVETIFSRGLAGLDQESRICLAMKNISCKLILIHCLAKAGTCS